MYFFIAMFFAIYSGMHALVYFRLKVLLPEARFYRPMLGVFFLLLIISPVITRYLENSGHHPTAKIAAHIAFPWFGFIFLLFITSLASYLVQGGFGLTNLFMGSRISAPGPKMMAVVALSLAVFMALYGFYENQRLVIERIVIHTDKLPAQAKSLKIAQITDLHLGLMSDGNNYKDVMEALDREKPDIVVSTGDMVDGSGLPEEKLAQTFSRIEAPLGKYAVTGNHEFYLGVDQAIAMTEKMGFTLIRDRSVRIDDLITLVGVDDPGRGRPVDEAGILTGCDPKLFTILLKHQPKPVKSSLGCFDLQLSGHTHGGQIFPFKYIVALFFPYHTGMYQLEKGSKLYTSRGTGTWGPPIRILAPRELTIIELTPESGD